MNTTYCVLFMNTWQNELKWLKPLKNQEKFRLLKYYELVSQKTSKGFELFLIC